ncbi:MAG TPA: hypothetical protein VKT77_03530 [Chthonomonadaceae bacterium]|nr:hypothetical protein [Chthonomonadaceae bacterium]
MKAVLGVNCFLLTFVLLGPCANAADQVEVLKRDVEGLSKVKTVAVLPVIVQLSFEHDSHFPDGNRMTSRLAIATGLPAMIEQQMKGGKFVVIPAEAGALALKESNIDPTELYSAHANTTWDSPAEMLRNKSKDELALLTSQADLKKSPDDLTPFQYKWHNLPATMTGLASFKMDPNASLNVEKLRAVASKLDADAVLLVRVTDLDMHQSGNGSIGLPFHFRSRVNMQFTLVSLKDGTILWQARAAGTKSEHARPRSLGSPQDRRAMECAAGTSEVLINDLNGAGASGK